MSKSLLLIVALIILGYLVFRRAKKTAVSSIVAGDSLADILDDAKTF